MILGAISMMKSANPTFNLSEAKLCMLDRLTPATFAWLGTLLFAVLCALSVINHEMWRDELEAWMVAQNRSMPELIAALRMVGHPLLWYLLLAGLQRIGGTLFSMAILNGVVVAFSAFLLLRHAPLSRGRRLLLVMSYYWVYEYGTIARSYGLSLLLLIGAVLLYPQRQKRLWLIAVILALMINVHILNAVFAGGIAWLVFAERWRPEIAVHPAQIGRPQLLLATGILLVAVGLSIWQSMPVDEVPWSSGIQPQWEPSRAMAALKTVWCGIVPLPPLRIDFWNRSIVADGPAQNALSLVLLVVVPLLFARRPVLVIFLLLGWAALLFFFSSVYTGYQRHHGYLYLHFIAALILSSSFREKSLRSERRKAHRSRIDWRAAIETGLLAVNALALLPALIIDGRYPFSASREVARYLQKTVSEANPLIGDQDFAAMPVAGWLGRRFFYPEIGSMGYEIKWSHPSRQNLPLKRVRTDTTRQHLMLETARRMAREAGTEAVLVLNYALLTGEQAEKTFLRAIVTDERYFVYRIPPSAAQP